MVYQQILLVVTTLALACTHTLRTKHLKDSIQHHPLHPVSVKATLTEAATMTAAVVSAAAAAENVIAANLRNNTAENVIAVPPPPPDSWPLRFDFG